jgi:hypothetical protein
MGPPTTQGRQPDAKEFAILQVGMIEVGGNTICGLVSNPPDTIWTHNTGTGGGGKAEWIIVGNCADANTVRINPILTQGGAPRPDVIRAAGPADVPAKHGERLRVIVLPNSAAGEYQYQVLINGQPAQYASEASRGTFALCPEWPCRRSAIGD